jgi:dual oxidase
MVGWSGPFGFCVKINMPSSLSAERPTLMLYATVVACLISGISAGTSPRTTTTVRAATTTKTSFDAFSVSTSASALPTIAGQNASAANDTPTGHIEYPPYDGWYNNYAHPEWGAADTALQRLLPPAYADGAYAPSGAKRANPLEVARAVFDGPTGRPSYRNRTALLVFFGQQLVEEILDAQGSGCPPEYFNIPIPKGHPLFDPAGHGGREIPLLRGRYDARTGNSPNVPREQLMK